MRFCEWIQKCSSYYHQLSERVADGGESPSERLVLQRSMGQTSSMCNIRGCRRLKSKSKTYFLHIEGCLINSSENWGLVGINSDNGDHGKFLCGNITRFSFIFQLKNSNSIVLRKVINLQLLHMAFSLKNSKLNFYSRSN